MQGTPARAGAWAVGVVWIALGSLGVWAAESTKPIRVGLIGLDAHALPWTQIVNSPKATGALAEMRMVVGYPGGSPDIPQSMEILKNSLEPIRALGVEIVDSIPKVLAQSDAVMILSIDGRVHLEQARPVLQARKPLFIDKPLAASLADARTIVRLAEEGQVPLFSSSALRFAPGTAAVRSDPKVGKILGCDAFSPAPLEPHHPDLFYYGIHGVETLFTIMGPGCQTVSRVHADKADVVVGLWSDGRIGTFRGTREGPHTYGATVFGSQGIVASGRFEGYEPLLVEIARFFKTGKAPVRPQETLEILAFMEAADQSRLRGGMPVPLAEVFPKDRSTPSSPR